MRRALAAVSACAVAAACVLATAGPAAADDVPYTDPAQVGYIGFCDAQGHSIDGGSLDAVPFAAKAVGSAAAQPPYDGPGKVAFLDAYQPREGVTPAEWSGEELIATSTYSNAAHPMVAGTKGDISLRQFVGDYPPAWDGLVQLRLYLKTAEVPYDPLHYAATDIQVDGESWHVVRGGDVPCNSGRARSLAVQLAPSAAAGHLNPEVTSPAPDRSSQSSGTSSTGASSDGGDPSMSAVAGGGAPPGSDASSGSSSGSSFPVGYAVLGGLVLVLSLALLLTQRERLQEWRARRGPSSA